MSNRNIDLNVYHTKIRAGLEIMFSLDFLEGIISYDLETYDRVLFEWDEDRTV
jgi:hypothetical protein